ncbi:Phosphopantothenoylcysteine decarboxylase [Lysobacter sp. A03]|nr:Phosphopantothenoylcysteine decarboxylase [Lysobacter sp. A03]
MSGGALAGRHVVVSAGPTYEDIDPVRFLGNRSSGKMGFAIAAAAAARAAPVTLISGPVTLPTPDTGSGSLHRIDVRSAAQMHAAVIGALPADIYIGAAAVADYTPARVAAEKIKKSSGSDGLTLQLVRTRDILADLAVHPHRPGLLVGFAAETEEVERHARGKLAAKQLDLIAANRVGVAGSGFESDDNALVIYGSGLALSLGPASKHELAAQLLELICQRMPAATRASDSTR